MYKSNDIISLSETNMSDAHMGGGKFAGLAQIRPLLEKYKEQYGTEFDLPQTYAITTEAYDKYNIAQNRIPEKLVKQAKSK